ncbi:MAG TPA: hypothetical protein VLE49_09890 [Anaerolineales bacterium]|nr:hypothetical protein [Anaerolineales bacterium]
MNRLITAIVFVVLLFSQIVSCTLSAKPSVEEALTEMNIDRTTFASMKPCKQIEVYAGVGKDYLDQDHMVVLVPDWMDQIIDNQPPEVIADCISSEGLKQLQNLSQQSNSREEISFAIHALVYRAYNSKLLEYSQTRDFLHQAVCTANVEYPFQLILIHYTSDYKKLPDYYKEDDALERMRNELCNK